MLNSKGFILFDIDGVIRNVENSYRLSIKKTVKKFCGYEPDMSEIDDIKSEGIWNNDWDLSLELIKRFIIKKRLKLKPPIKTILIKSFENFYFGGDPNGQFNKWLGFINNEELLVEKNLFDELDCQKIRWGFVSGAEKASAKFILEYKLKLESPPLIAMNDAPDKPNPKGLISLARKLAKRELGPFVPPVVYLGDTIADIRTVLNAREEIPDQVFISIAVAPPHLHSENCIEERRQYETKLKDAGADIILNSTNDIKYLISDLFKNK